MKWLIILLILGALVWTFSSKGRGRSSASNGSLLADELAEGGVELAAAIEKARRR